MPKKKVADTPPQVMFVPAQPEIAAEESVAPDPGNAQPEVWTEDLTDTEQREIARLLEDEFGGAS